MPVPATQRVRIIGGRFRGRVIRFPRATGVRPTPDRVRETLFNWLGQDLTELSTLDLFAGSGALSLEALSRGAARAVVVDRDGVAVRAIAETAKLFGADALEPHVGDAQVFLSRETRRFDVIFLDPPFDTHPWDWLLRACAERLAVGGYIYAEANRALSPPAALAAWRQSRAGHVHYHLFRRAQAPDTPTRADHEAP